MSEFYKTPDYLALTGSKLYGTSTPSSDEDYRGFVLPPAEYYLGLNRFDQFEDPNSDTVVWSLKKFFEILINGNTNAFEALFSNTYQCTSLGQTVRDNRSLFISRYVYKSIKGYAYHEELKAFGLVKTIKSGDKKRDQITQDFFSAWQIEAHEREHILDGIFAGRDDDPRKVEKNPNKFGNTRADSINKFGYCSKNASHCIRLLEQGQEILYTGNLTFPRPNAKFLFQVKMGEIPKKDVLSYISLAKGELDLAEQNSTLPSKVDRKQINELYMSLIPMKQR